MSVTNQTPIGAAIGNGVTTVFPFTYYIAATSDLVVKLEGVTLTLVADYTVTGAGNLSGGTITMTAAPAIGARLAHYRDTALTRATDYQDGGDLLAPVLNLDFDRLWLALQEIFSGGKGAPTSLRVPAGETIQELPSAADRAGRIVGFDEDGQVIATLPAPGDSTALALDLINKTTATKGPALVGFNPTLNYTAGTIGRQLYDQPLNPRAFPWLAKFDNATDDTAALNACFAAARASSGAVALPAGGTALVSSSLDVSGLHVIAYGGHTHAHIRATSAQFDVITTTGGTVLEGLFVHGGWDGSTAGLSGDAISIKATSPAYPYDVHLRNIRVLNAKRTGIYWERGGYSSCWNAKVNACGLHGLYLFGNSGSDACTTVTIGGFSIFSDCPNGYGVKLNECININFTGVISEYTKGIQITGGSNRALTFYAYYQENTSGGKFIDWAGSSGIGIEVRGCFGGGAAIDYNENWLDQYYGPNPLLTAPAIPFANRIVISDGGEATSSTTGGINVTAASISLTPGTWEIDGYVQTTNAVTGTITQLGGYITTNVADGGLQTATNVLVFGADSQLYNPGASVAALRVNPRRIIQNTGSAAATVYLRAFLNITAGTVAWRGALQAKRLD